MKKLYLITGATGHVGTVLVSKLIEYNKNIRVLVLPDDKGFIPSDVEICIGDITKKESLSKFFNRDGYDSVTLIHCAALISIASQQDERLWNINVNGTDNIMQEALNSNVERVIYVSSVHAIPESKKTESINEVNNFSPKIVHGQYAKSKAEAAQKVLDYAKKGLNVSIVHPSGIIGPGDLKFNNNMIRTINAIAEDKISFAIEGGYDFVDSRDVVDGIIECEKKGVSGECYILSGHYMTISNLVNTVRKIKGKREIKLELPYIIVKFIAPIFEYLYNIFGKSSPLFTPYSVYTLNTNGNFSHKKASLEFGYSPRDINESIRDSII